jgi:hypothetical protein
VGQVSAIDGAGVIKIRGAGLSPRAKQFTEIGAINYTLTDEVRGNG